MEPARKEGVAGELSQGTLVISHASNGVDGDGGGLSHAYDGYGGAFSGDVPTPTSAPSQPLGSARDLSISAVSTPFSAQAWPQSLDEFDPLPPPLPS